MTPVEVIIWSCVAIFIVTAILTLLHISGIRPLPNADHGKVLFRALIVEVVVVAVGAFASTLLPKQEKPTMGSIPGSMAANQGVFLPPAENDESEPLLPRPAETLSKPFQAAPSTEPLDANCHQITVSDASTFPPTSHIETVCEK